MNPVMKVIEPTTEIDKLLYKTRSIDPKRRWMEVGESKTCLPVAYGKNAEKIENFQVRPDDIYVATHPRSGTTWTLEMTWLVANDCDFEGAKKLLNSRVPFLESYMMIQEDKWDDTIKKMPFMDVFANAPHAKSPRIYKTHNPFNLLPRQIRDNQVEPKVIYVMRNPKDVCISFYHFSKLMNTFVGTFDEFCEMFLAGRVTYGPYWSHIFSYWNQRHRSNLLIIRFEDMKRNMPDVLRKLAKFLNKEITEEQIVQLTDHLSFDKLSKNQHVNNEETISRFKQLQEKSDESDEKFIRKGQIGGHKEEMSPEMIRRFDEWIEESTKGTDLHFD